MQPWLAAVTLTQDEYAHNGLSREYSLEKFVESLARKDRKPIGALEMARDQIIAMADAPAAEQEAFLNSIVSRFGKNDSQIQTLRDAWNTGNETLLRSALEDATIPQQSSLHRSLIEVRNQRWIAKLRKIADQGQNTLVLVGIEHLVANSYSLPKLLEQNGFVVRRIESKLDAESSRSQAAH
jgi:uncharacterized protein YbaP (TraB family)